MKGLFFLAQQPPVGQSLLIHEVSRSHIRTHHTRKDSSERVISSSQRPMPDNTLHSEHTDIHAPGGIRNHNFSRRAAADIRLRLSGHWDQHNEWVAYFNLSKQTLLKFKSTSYFVSHQMQKMRLCTTCVN
jgi:hypothetical protein